MLDLNLIRKSLESNRLRLLKRVKSSSKDSPRLKPLNPTRSDLAWRYDSQQRKRLLRAKAQSQLAQVEDALARLDSGAYGQCVNCKKPIHPDRLRAMPAATLCIECKHQTE